MLFTSSPWEPKTKRIPPQGFVTEFFGEIFRKDCHEALMAALIFNFLGSNSFFF